MTRSDPAAATVFVPVTVADWQRLVAARELPGPIPAYGVTPGLWEWGGFAADETEDALFAAQSVAAVAALTLDEADPGARRIVLAVGDDDFTADDTSPLGAGVVAGLDLDSVRAVFSDPADVAVAPIRQVAAGRSVAQAWDDPLVAAFSDEHDLGWYGVEECLGW